MRSVQLPDSKVFSYSLSRSDSPGILTHGRMFAPFIGINEDPVTGNGNGPLGAYLVKHNLVKHDGKFLKFSGKQGEAMGRPGTVDVESGYREHESRESKNWRKCRDCFSNDS